MAILLLSPQTIAPPQGKSANLPQKLMQRRYANAVTAPDLNADGNPLLRPVTGGGLPVKTTALTRVGDTAGPVADLILPERRTGTEALQTPGLGERVREANLTVVTNIDEPVARLNLPEREVDVVFNSRVGEGLETRQANLTTALGADEPVALLTLPVRTAGTMAVVQPGVGLETRGLNLAETLGIGDPVALLNLPAREIGVLGGEIALPAQKLMRRRYARAVTNPELQEAVPAPSIVIIPPDQGTSLLRQEADKPWRRYAARVPADAAGKPKIVIIIDDMGNNSAMAQAFSQLPSPLTFAFLPYAPNLERQTGAMRAGGHELLVHLPMEPTGNETPGPHALLTSLSPEQVLETVDWNLNRFEGFVGVNNHMGSRFIKDRARMALVMGELQRRGLLFLDSRTVANSEGARLAQSLGMPWAGRDIFLDNEVNDAAILAQLMEVERIARSRGLAIAIGHPHDATLRVLEQWISTLEAKGFVLVPLSSVVEFNPNPKLAEARQ